LTWTLAEQPSDGRPGVQQTQVAAEVDDLATFDEGRALVRDGQAADRAATTLSQHDPSPSSYG